MKLGSLFIAAIFLASSSAWAGFPGPNGAVTVHKVQTLKLKTATIQSKEGKTKTKTKTENINDKDLAATLCGGTQPDNSELVALVNCPVEDDGSGSSLQQTGGFWLTVVDKDTGAQVCDWIFVEVFDENFEVDKNGEVSQINGLIYSEFGDVWFEGSATISAKELKDKEKYGACAGKISVSKVKTKSVVGAEETEGPDNPITDGKLKIGGVNAGTVIAD
jgi:hypothetical protein